LSTFSPLWRKRRKEITRRTSRQVYRMYPMTVHNRWEKRRDYKTKKMSTIQILYRRYTVTLKRIAESLKDSRQERTARQQVYRMYAITSQRKNVRLRDSTTGKMLEKKVYRMYTVTCHNKEVALLRDNRAGKTLEKPPGRQHAEAFYKTGIQ
jgi:hypothetical protein